ncbi:MAG TPA: hypothetical protein VFK22_06420 [Candidatus Dormibacteraeota bacterium]|nr:hypothetical protein [Candidatus Dormibacteraeota bacterium]
MPLACASVYADPTPPPTYPQAVAQAYALIAQATPPNTVPAAEALQVMIAGTGDSQPEILFDLRARPPLYADARQRLQALLAALNQPADTTDAALAQQRLHQVMSMSRYDALHRPPSLLDRIKQWISDRINDLLRLLFGRSGGAQPPALWLYATGVAVLLVIVFLVVRAARGRFSQAYAPPSDGPRPPEDYFAEADRLATAGDRVGALRALCAAVAATLAGEGSWQGSPLTVREIFLRSRDFASLRPLLIPFEAAVYGGRDVDEATFARAAAAAAPFRAKEKAA